MAPAHGGGLTAEEKTLMNRMRCAVTPFARMKANDDGQRSTRASLIHRLKDWRDDSSWRTFFNVYWKLIYGVARKAGLTDAEAQEVVQETLISVAKHMPTFKYDPSVGSFRAWLLNLTRWRIIGQFRRRQPVVEHNPIGDGTTRIGGVETAPDPKSLDLDAVWEAEWEANLVKVAMENLRRRINPQMLQIFEFYVNKEWPAQTVAQRFGVSTDQVYQAKHRVMEAIRAEINRLEKVMT